MTSEVPGSNHLFANVLLPLFAPTAGEGIWPPSLALPEAAHAAQGFDFPADRRTFAAYEACDPFASERRRCDAYGSMTGADIGIRAGPVNHRRTIRGYSRGPDFIAFNRMGRASFQSRKVSPRHRTSRRLGHTCRLATVPSRPLAQHAARSDDSPGTDPDHRRKTSLHARDRSVPQGPHQQQWPTPRPTDAGPQTIRFA